MEHLTISKNMQVGNLLAQYPQLANLLIDLQVDCVGCSMSKFCTLEDVCRQYELTLKEFLKAIEIRINP
jgi:hybrid cluster-associated redox disulfide protein